MSKKEIVDLLINIGAIVTIILATLSLFNIGWGWWGWGWFHYIMDGLAIFLGLCLLGMTGLIKAWPVKIAKEFIWVLIIGLIIVIPCSNYGGIPVIVAAFYDKFA